VTRCAPLLAALALAVPLSAAEPVVLKLWPGKAPGEAKDLGPETSPGSKSDSLKRLTNVSEPTLSVYPAAKDKNTGAAVLVAPGGGYSHLAIEHEGTMTAAWLNSVGVTAAVLKYRVPRRDGQTPPNLAAVQDAQRAMSLLRAGAAEWGADPNRVGMIGFSAGGNLAAWTCLNPKRMYDPVDKSDEIPYRPAFAVLLYPGGMLDTNGELKPEFQFSKDSPPICLAHASDDKGASGPENSVALYRAAKAAGVPAELHLYGSGGHGFGMKKVPHPVATWPDRAADWMKARGVLNGK
jgi:acetyl esterase/lipase